MNKQTLNRDKFENTILYITKKCSSLPHFGKTDLYKALYFSDFDYYELHEEPLTGESYRKIRKGPAPCHFNEVLANMEKTGKIASCTIPYHGYKLQKFIPKIEPDLTIFNGDEIKVIDRVVEKISSMNATQISDYSHQDVPYKATEDKQIINYELVFYRDPMFSVREYNDD